MKKIWQEAMDYWKAKPAYAQYKLWAKEMQRYDYAIISRGFGILKREKRFFPTTNEWLAVVDSLWDIQQDKEFKQEDKDAKDFWAKPANDWKPLIALLRGEITRSEFLEQMKTKGLDVSELESFYKKQELPLDLKAGTQDFKARIPKKYRDTAILKDESNREIYKEAE